MRTTLKMVLPLIVSVAVVSVLFAAYQVRTEKRILRNDLSRREEILGESLQESVEPLLDRGPDRNLQRLVERFGQREHLQGVAVYNAAGTALADSLASSNKCQRAVCVSATAAKTPSSPAVWREWESSWSLPEQTMFLVALLYSCFTNSLKTEKLRGTKRTCRRKEADWRLIAISQTDGKQT